MNVRILVILYVKIENRSWMWVLTDDGLIMNKISEIKWFFNKLTSLHITLVVWEETSIKQGIKAKIKATRWYTCLSYRKRFPRNVEQMIKEDSKCQGIHWSFCWPS